jgi:hypothetical protein
MLVYELTGQERASAIDITAMLKAIALVHNLAARLPLSEIVAAHRMVENGKAIGNAVMDLGEATRTAVPSPRHWQEADNPPKIASQP